MKDKLHFYINGNWVESESQEKIEVINPANEELIGHVAAGTTGDVDNNSSQNNHVALDLREYALEIRDVSLKKEWAVAHAGDVGRHDGDDGTASNSTASSRGRATARGPGQAPRQRWSVLERGCCA